MPPIRRALELPLATAIAMSTWRQGPDLGLLDSSEFIGYADFTLGRLRNIGVPIPPDSRIERARRWILASLNGSQVNPTLLREVLRTIFETRFVAQVLDPSGPPLTKKIKNALAVMLSGPDVSSDESGDGKTCRPRNHQFELYLGAMMAAGSLQVTYEEPDLALEYLGYQIGVAAKRPQNRKNIVKHTLAAAKQVMRAFQLGIVVVNVDCLIDEAADVGADWADIAAYIDAQPEIHESKAWIRRQPRLKGLVTVGTYAFWNVRSKLEMRTYLKWFLQGPDAEKTAADRFVATFEREFTKRLQNP